MTNDKRTIRQVMTSDPVKVPADQDLTAVARRMRDDDIGFVLVENDDGVCGVLTDRDLTVRAIGEDRTPQQTKAGEICTTDLVTIDHDDPLGRAVELMTKHAVRRLAVTDDSKTIGVLSIGDLAIHMDPSSALAEISKAPSNN